MAKLSKSTVIGLVLGIFFIVGSIVVGGTTHMFWNLPSLFITVGGTFSAVVIAFPPKRLKVLWPVIKRAFVRDNYDTEKDIDTIISLAEVSRREGLLALDDVLEQYTDDQFIKKGIRLIIDGADEDQLRNLLNGAMYFMKQRHQKGAAMLDMIAATAPALGLLGTYVGLIPMLNSLDDPTTLGPMMALELISSFYGGFIAYVIFSPLAKRLKIMNGEEEERMEILIEGLAAIQQGKNPKLIKEELYSYVNRKFADEIEDKEVRETVTERRAV